MFSPFTHKHPFVFSHAPLGAFSCVILNPRQRVAACSPGWSRACGVDGSRDGVQALPIYGPLNGWLLWIAPPENEILPVRAGRNPACRGSKSTLRVVEICRLRLQTKKPRNLFRFRGFIYPGSYLLSRDLSSDYHRRADVSLPGSEWDRVGPSGYDHQVSGSSSLCCSLLTSVIICACGLLLCVLAAGWWAAG